MKRILVIFILIINCLLLSSCGNGSLIMDTELRNLKNEYDSLVERKEELENELAMLEERYENYPEIIADLKERIKNIDTEISDTYSLFSTLQNDTLKGAVIVTHYLYDEQGWFFKEEVIVDGALGSGFVIKENSSYYYILTNNHVIDSEKSADKESIYVYDYNMNQYTATLMFTDSKYDMAVVRINKNSSFEALKVMKLADKNPNKGDDVIAIGQPQGQVNSITVGKIKNYVSIANVNYTVIYHDAWIDHGNSGGMLLDINLNVVGINTWGGENNSYTNHESLSSPVEKIKEFLKSNSFTV